MNAAEAPPSRIVIERVAPEINAGRFPVKRTVGEHLVVEADIFTDGQEALSAILKHRLKGHAAWTETPMNESDEDRWTAAIPLDALGIIEYTIEAWANAFESWLRALARNAKAAFDVTQELVIGAALLERTADMASPEDAARLRIWANLCSASTRAPDFLLQPDIRCEVNRLLGRYRSPGCGCSYGKTLECVVDPSLARFGAWYEVFPRSCSAEPGRHGTLKDLVRVLPKLADMGFDVVYLPPIHPIGLTARKGKNNTLIAELGDPGSPWGIGAREGGHKAVHPELGSIEDFRFLLATARELKLEIALDIAFQCSPDHPYVREHPEWFQHRPDGSIACAESPPHRYEDIYPFDFNSREWTSLWMELRSVFIFWIEVGVRIFRVDNPHTKPLPFWHWIIADLKRRWPEAIFLSEGLTRPKLMTCLAKVGFSQSYDYFPWRNCKAELIEYYTLLTNGELKEFFRPCLWPNTPQLLPPILQHGGRPAFVMRLILAGTLGASYGIYGPVFEHCESRAVVPGSTDYLDSEQYELKCWEWDDPSTLRDLVTHLNYVRRANAALQANDRLVFHDVENDQIIAFSKSTADHANVILSVVNLDPLNPQSGWTGLNLAALGLDAGTSYTAHDLLTGERYLWRGSRNYVELNPSHRSAHVLRIEPDGG